MLRSSLGGILPRFSAALTLLNNNGRQNATGTITKHLLHRHRLLVSLRQFHASQCCLKIPTKDDEIPKSTQPERQGLAAIDDVDEEEQPDNKIAEGEQEEEAERDFALPFEADAAPKRLRDKAGYFRASAYRFSQGNTTYLSREEQEGTVGATSLLSMDTSDVDKHLPDLRTMNQLFDDVPWVKLPIVHIKASWNNTIVHAFDINTNRAIMYTSARKEGFKHAKKKTQLAGQAAGVGAAQKLLRRGVTTVRVAIKGIGPGRMSSVKGLIAAGVNVVSISDVTPLPELGPRPRKIRRV